MSGARDRLVIASAVSWFHPLFQRPHQLARAFARRGFEVVFVEPGFEFEGGPEWVESAGSRIELQRFREDQAPASYTRFVELSRRSLWKARALTEPLGLIAWYNLKLRPWLRVRLRGRQIAERVLARGPVRRLLLLEYPETGFDRILERARGGGATVIYDMLDDFQAMDGHADRVRVEAQLLARADLVLATAARLEQAARPKARALLRVPNGVEPAHFAAARGAVERPPLWPFPGESGPVIGYIGAIWDWFDVETVVTAARARPDWRFLLVGMARPEIRARLEVEPNLRCVDAQPFEELPRWLAGFSVATVPFLDNAVTRATNPVKVFEYLAAGKPVVASDLPEVRGFPHVEIAQGPDAFVSAIERALATPIDLERIDAFLADNTWERRVDAILGALDRRPG